MGPRSERWIVNPGYFEIGTSESFSLYYLSSYAGKRDNKQEKATRDEGRGGRKI